MASSTSVQTPTSGKRKRSEDQGDETDTGDSQENESPNSSESRGSSEGKIPHDISKWKEEHIQSLSIMVQYEENTTPSDLLAEYISPRKNTFLRRYLDKFEKYFLHCGFHTHLDDELGLLSVEKANLFRDKSYYSTKVFIDKNFTESEPPQDVLDWCQRFEVAGIMFGERLYFTILKRDLDIIMDKDDNRKDPLTEYDFQFLFEAFTAIFQFKSFNWFAPLLRSRILSYSHGCTAAGKTDIIYCQDIDTDVKMPFCSMENIVAICEVKKYYKEPEKIPAMVTQQHESPRISSSSTKRSLPPHMSLAELGQLGGELLLYSQQSFAKDVIFGIFVQETKVSFAVLKITAAEYNGILSGNHEKSNPKLIITRPFDYMKKEDRKHLIKALLQLSMIQEMKYGMNK